MDEKMTFIYDPNFIYELIDPITKQTRYIGKTKDPRIRFNAHMNCSDQNSAEKNIWIAELKASGLLPIMKIIEECNSKEAFDRETFHIREYQKKGCDLLNKGYQCYDINGFTCISVRLTNKIFYDIEEIANGFSISKEKLCEKIIEDYILNMQD